MNIPGTWTAEGDFVPDDGSATLYHDPNKRNDLTEELGLHIAEALMAQNLLAVPIYVALPVIVSVLDERKR